MDSLPTIWNDPVVEGLGWALVHFCWLAAALVGAAAGTLLLLRRRRPFARYRAGVCWYSLVALVPILLVARLLSTPAGWDPDAVGLPANFASGILNATTHQPLTQLHAPLPDFGASASTGAMHLVADAAPWLFIAWIVAAIGLCALKLAAWAVMRSQIRASQQPCPPELQRRLESIRQRMNVPGNVRFVVSAMTEVPATAGARRPIVLLPPQVLDRLTADHIEAIVAHELAHVLRRDYAVNLLQSFGDAAMFFHPAVRWLSRRIRDERENCCDDVASRATRGGAPAYAEALLAIEESRAARPAFAQSASGGNLLRRVKRLFGVTPAEGLGGALVWLSSMFLLLLLAGQLYASTETVRHALLAQRQRSLSEEVYETLGVPTGGDGDAFLNALAATVSSLPPGQLLTGDPDSGKLTRLVGALLNGSPPNTLERVAVQCADPANGWSFDSLPAWRYGEPLHRMRIAQVLWAEALRDRTSDTTESRRRARAAVLLYAQDYSSSRATMLNLLLGDADSAQLLGVSQTQRKELLQYLSGYQRATNIFFRLNWELPRTSKDESGQPSETTREGVEAMAAAAINRPDLQLTLARVIRGMRTSPQGSPPLVVGGSPLAEFVTKEVGQDSFARWVAAPGPDERPPMPANRIRQAATLH